MNDSSVKIHEVLDLAPLRLIWDHLPSRSPAPQPHHTHRVLYIVHI